MPRADLKLPWLNPKKLRKTFAAIDASACFARYFHIRPIKWLEQFGC